MCSSDRPLTMVKVSACSSGASSMQVDIRIDTASECLPQCDPAMNARIYRYIRQTDNCIWNLVRIRNILKSQTTDHCGFVNSSTAMLFPHLATETGKSWAGPQMPGVLNRMRKERMDDSSLAGADG